MICETCGQLPAEIGRTERKNLPVLVCACDVARVWSLVSGRWVLLELQP